MTRGFRGSIAEFWAAAARRVGAAASRGRQRVTAVGARRSLGPALLVGLLVGLTPPSRAEEPSGAQGILDEIAQYDAQLADLDKAEVAMTQREAAIRSALAAHQGDVTAATAEIDRRRASVDQGLRAAYRLQRRGFARLLFDAQSPDELRRRVYYLLATVHAQQSAMVAFADTVDARTKAAAAADAEMKSLAGVQAEREKHRAALKEERAHRVALLRSVRGSPQLSGQYGDERMQAQSQFNATLAPMSDAEPVIEIDHSSAPGGSEAFRGARGSLPWPLHGRIVQGWGTYQDPMTQATLQNLGLDIAAAPGTPFRSVFAGTVTRSGYVRGYGQVVIVQHGSYSTLFAHANGLRVSQGQDVQAGDILGLVGSTGLLDESEARLHFEVRYNGTPQNPGEWLQPGR